MTEAIRHGGAGRGSLFRLRKGGAARLFEEKLNSNLQIPTDLLGVFFAFSTVFFFTFIVVLSLQVVFERQPVTSFELRNAVVTSMIPQYTSISDRSSCQSFLASFMTTSPFFSAQPFTALHMFLNPTRVRVQRTSSVLCSSVVSTSASAECFDSLRGPSDVNTSSYRFGVRLDASSNRSRLVTLPFIEDDQVCIGTLCSTAMASKVISTTRYDFSGNAFLVLNGSAVDPLNTSSILVPTIQDRSALPQLQDLITALTDDSVRALFIEQVVYCPSTSMVATLELLVEFHGSGLVVPSAHIQTSATFDTTSGSSVFLWIYGSIQLAILTFSVCKAAYSSFSSRCVACSRTLLVYSCLKCRTPCVLKVEEVSLCENCDEPIPSLRHRCIRRIVTDLWTTLSLISMIALLVSRYASVMGSQRLGDLLASSLARAQPASSFEPFSQTVEVYRYGTSIIIPTIIATYLRLYYYVCRGKRAAQFARALEYSMPALAAFTVNFFVAFSGFCFAFNLLDGSRTASFSTLSSCYLTAFRLLLGMVDWKELGSYSTAFFVVLVFFTLTCYFLMFNSFPSVLTFAYKKAARTPHFDIEVLSLWLLFKRMARVFGFMKPIASRRRSAASSLSTITGASDEKMEQLEALRRGISIEEVERNQKIQNLLKTVASLSTEIESFELTTSDQLANIEHRFSNELMSRIPAIVDRHVSAYRDSAAHPRRPAKKSEALQEAEKRTRIFIRSKALEQGARPDDMDDTAADRVAPADGIHAIRDDSSDSEYSRDAHHLRRRPSFAARPHEHENEAADWRFVASEEEDDLEDALVGPDAAAHVEPSAEHGEDAADAGTADHL